MNKEYTDPKLFNLLSPRDGSNITINPTFNFMVKNEPSGSMNSIGNETPFSDRDLYFSFNSKKK